MAHHPRSRTKQSVDQSVIYGERLNKSRCISSVIGDEQSHTFLVGTHSLTAENEVHLIHFSEDTNNVFRDKLFVHPNEVWSISPCPSKANIFFTVYNNGKQYCSSLWRMPGIADDGSATLSTTSEDYRQNTLEEMFAFPAFETTLHSVLWDPSGLTDRVVTIDNDSLKEWHLDQDMRKLGDATVHNVGNKLTMGCWNPLLADTIAVAAGPSIYAVDMRQKRSNKLIDNAHIARVRDFDFNPFDSHSIVSGGDDGRVKFWDTRKTNEALRVLNAHSHWVTNVKFSPSNAQLVLSASTDTFVKLWNIKALSESATTDNKYRYVDYTDNDFLVKSLNEHEESIYSVAWSSHSTWIFASVSYDGRVLIHHVPQAEKFKMLLPKD